MPDALPHLQCRYFESAGLPADSDFIRWTDVVPMRLSDVVSAAEPEQGTWVKVAWTSRDFLVLFHAEDVEPWATLTERDAPLYTEEVCEVFLDPVGDLESYFEFEVNPLNTVLDLIIRRNRSGLAKNFKWRCEGLRTAVRVEEGFWEAQFAIPFRGLIVQSPKVGVQWRGNFCRIDRPRNRERELSAWSPTGRALFHVPERFGVIEFV